MSTPSPTPSSPIPSASSASAATCPRCARPIPANAVLGACPHCLLAAGLTSEPAAPDSTSPPPSPAELAPEFPQVELIELLGRGGMGAVYKARQKSLDRLVALKLLRPGLDADPSFAERFTREARALAQLNHSGIVTLYEFGRTPGGLYFILMEFVDGLNLRQLLAAGRLSPREALAIVPPLCDALQYAHDRGLIHRDIKPENILIDRLGRVKIADFGLAKLAPQPPQQSSASASDHSSPLTLHPSHTGHWSLVTGHSTDGETAAGQVFGTPGYMAPEQRERPATVDHRADIYALGVVLYQLLTGELPDAKQLQPPSHRVHLDIRLDAVVLRALEKNPALRFAAASELKTQIETVTRPGDLSKPDATATTQPVTVTAPRALKIVAALLIGCGVYGLLRIVLKDSGPVPFVFKNSLIAAPLGLGLWHMRPGSYRAAQIALGLVFVSMLVWGTLVFTPVPRLLEDNFTSISVPPSIYEESRGFKGAINAFNLVSFSALTIWMWTVLRRPSIAALFKQRSALHSPTDPHRALRIGALTFAVLYTLHLAWISSSADELPAQVASHFGMNGRADGYMSRNSYLLFICAFPLGLGLFLQATTRLAFRLPARFVNIPNREIWLAPARRPELVAILQSWFASLSCGLVIFSAQLHTLTLLANRLNPPRLPDIALVTLIGFPSILLLWTIGLLMRLADPQAAAKLHTRRSLILAIVSVTLLGFFTAPSIIAWNARNESGAPPKPTSHPTSSVEPDGFPSNKTPHKSDDSAAPAKPTPTAEQPLLSIQVPANTEYPKVIALMDAVKKADFNRITFATFPTTPSEPPTAHDTLPKETTQEILRLKLAEAQNQLATAKFRADAGLTNRAELHDAQDTVAILEAELVGDHLKIAQIKVAAAERRLSVATSRYETGQTTRDEVASAKTELTIRQLELEGLLKPQEAK